MSNRALATVFLLALCMGAAAAQSERVELDAGWKLQDAAKVLASGAVVSSAKFTPHDWYAATVPGTVLTTLVNNHVYPEPLYGENDRAETIPEGLARSSYWYRTKLTVPKTYRGRHVWLDFEGVNYAATVWVNGAKAGTMRGAFARGLFDITALVKPGSTAVLAVLVEPQPHPGTPHEHTLRAGIGANGGESAIDGPTFLSTLGWDWLATVRDRDSGIWQSVFLESSGPVRIQDPLVTTDLPLPRTDSADVSVEATLENLTDLPQRGVLRGQIEAVAFERSVELAPHSNQTVSFTAQDTPALRLQRPRLWWPNGYGEPAMYALQLEFAQGKSVSDAQQVRFGVRKVQYATADSDNLTLSVNGVKVFVRGGDWGLDEAMKREPRERLEAQIRLHKLANLNLIRNWVGQSTSEAFYELCDENGIMLWDEFFQPNPGDGPNPTDIATYTANVRDKILRFRNHPSIVLWCARNEGDPPHEIDAAIRKLMAELEPTRLYQASSTDGRGVKSGGPYRWRAPHEFYTVDAPFKTEIGSVSVPTLESVHGMMPQKDWESINDDWAEHDFARGNSGSESYPATLAARYGAIVNLADFVRKAQLANFEAYRAMYEGREAKLFAPATAVITWMSNPAQPSFVWQLYHYDLEPNASLYGVQHAGESVHVQWNELTDEVEVVNNLPSAVPDASVQATVYALDGTILNSRSAKVSAAPDAVTAVMAVAPGPALQFVRLELRDAAGKLLSRNLYWRGAAGHRDDLTALDRMPVVALRGSVARADSGGKTVLTVTLSNPTVHMALMTHLQLRRSDGQRVLPAYASDNYLSLAPGESRTVEIEAATAALGGQDALVAVDGWNVRVVPVKASGAAVEVNVDALVEHWPTTGLPYQTTGLR